MKDASTLVHDTADRQHPRIQPEVVVHKKTRDPDATQSPYFPTILLVSALSPRPSSTRNTEEHFHLLYCNRKRV